MTEDDDDIDFLRPSGDLSLLGQIETKARELIAIARTITDLTLQLETAKVRKREIEENELPTVMTDARISDITVDNIEIEKKQLISAELPKTDPQKRTKIFDWLLAHGHGGVIQRELITHLPKGDDVALHKLLDASKGISGITQDVVETIHYQTYLALCRQLMREDKPVPTDLLNIFSRPVAKIKIPKESK